MTVRLQSIFTSFLLFLASLSPAAAKEGSLHTWAEHSVLSQGSWTKIALNQKEDGIFQISYAELRKWGFSKPEQVGVYGYGGHVLNESFASNHIDDLPEVAVLHDKEHSRILFYGRGTIAWETSDGTFVQKQHPYSSYAYYFLHQKEEAVKSLQAQTPGNPAEVKEVLHDYQEYWLHEKEEVNLEEEGRRWFGESFAATTVQTFAIPEESALKGHVLKEGKIEVAMGVYSTVETSFKVRVNSKELGSKSIGVASSLALTPSLQLDLKELCPLTNPKVSITFSQGSEAPKTARLDYIRIVGKCDLEASDKEPYMLFRHSSAINQNVAYHVEGLTSQMQIWDVTSPTEVELTTLSDTLLIPNQQGLREYAVVNTASSSFPTVSNVGQLSNNIDLHGVNTCDLVVIAPSGLYEQADRLAKHRAKNDGLSSLVVTPDAIYNEYSSGVPDVTAIRLFLKHLYDKDSLDTPSLRYCLLFGDGLYDNILSTSSNYYLPCYEMEGSLDATVTDGYFAVLQDGSGANLPTDKMLIGVGRIPVSTPAQAKEVVDKLIAYDSDKSGSWRSHITLMGDDDKVQGGENKDGEDYVHVKQANRIAETLISLGHKEIMFKKIFLTAYPRISTSAGADYPEARKDMMDALQQGTLMMNFIGHGNADYFTDESLMNTATAKNLRMKHLPIWFLGSCNVGRWDRNTITVCEQLLLNPNGGACALLTPTRESLISNNGQMSKAFASSMFDRLPDGSRFRLGDMFRTASNSLSGSGKLVFSLLGDPSMKPGLPEQTIVVDSIQGKCKTLGTITVYGHVKCLDSEEVDTTFTGLIYPTVFDTEETIIANKGLRANSAEDYSFTSRTCKVFTGRDAVRSGRFSFSFMIPKDVSDKEGKGIMNFYAASVSGMEANGYYEDFTIEHDDEVSEWDSIPPTILSCYLDNPNFKDGDVVSSTPFFFAELYDQSGINATGNGIGHDISLTLKCLSNPVIATQQYLLNNYFTTFTGHSSHGNVKYSIQELEEGTYQALFRVFDIYNNVSSKTITFTVKKNSHPAITAVYATPAPVKQGETVTFVALHNRPESADEVHLQIFSQSGRKVLDRTLSSTACEAVYMEQDAQGHRVISQAVNADEGNDILGKSTLTWSADVLPGIYLYRIYLKAGGEEAASQSQKLIVQ